MFLKNKSKSATVTIRTRKGLISVAPQQVVEVEEKDILTIHSFLESVESEINEPVKSILVKPSPKSEEVVPETPKVSELQAPIEPKPSQEEVVNKEGEETEVLDKQQEQALTTVEVSEQTELEKLEQELESLKQTWQITTRPKKKESIQKRIKEVEAQIANLK